MSSTSKRQARVRPVPSISVTAPASAPLVSSTPAPVAVSAPKEVKVESNLNYTPSEEMMAKLTLSAFKSATTPPPKKAPLKKRVNVSQEVGLNVSTTRSIKVISDSLQVHDRTARDALQEQLKPYRKDEYYARIRDVKKGNVAENERLRAEALARLAQNKEVIKGLEDRLREVTANDHHLSDDVAIPNGVVLDAIIEDAVTAALSTAYSAGDKTVQPKHLHSVIFRDQSLTFPLISGTEEFSLWTDAKEQALVKQRRAQSKAQRDADLVKQKEYEALLESGQDLPEEKRTHSVRLGFAVDISHTIDRIRESPAFKDLSVSTRFREHLNNCLIQFQVHVANQADIYCNRQGTKLFRADDYVTVISLSLAMFHTRETAREFTELVSRMDQTLQRYRDFNKHLKEEKEANMTPERKRQVEAKKAQLEQERKQKLLESSQRKLEKVQKELVDRKAALVVAPNGVAHTGAPVLASVTIPGL